MPAHERETEAAREERRDSLPWKARRRRAPAEAGSEDPARAPTADRGTRAEAQTWPGRAPPPAGARATPRGGRDRVARPSQTPPWPDGPNPASRRASLPFPAAPPATPGPRLAVPPRTPEPGPAASARGAAYSPLSAPRRRVPRAPLFFPQNSRTRTLSRDPGPPTARDPFLPPLPRHRLPTGLSPRPPGRGVWCGQGRVGAGLRAPP